MYRKCIPCRVAFRLIIAVMVALVLSSVGFVTNYGCAQEVERKIKTKVPPSYPELAKKMAIAGTVKVEIVIDASGSVKSAKAVGGHPLLIPAAVEAAKKWRYEPGAEATTVVEFKFSPS